VTTPTKTKKKESKRTELTLIVDLETAQKLEAGNRNIEDELARLEWAEKKAAKVLFTKPFPFWK